MEIARNAIAESRSSESTPSVGARLRIVAIDEDESFRKSLTAALEQHGCWVTPLPDGQSLLDSPGLATDADVILLDWALIGMSRNTLLTRLRKLGITVPVVVLTGRSLTVDEAMAFDGGAVDVVDKSRDVSILVHRLRVAASLKGAEAHRQSNLVCGRLVLKPHVSRAFWDGVDLELTMGEFRIVHLLARNVGHYVSYREIYDRVRYPGFVSGSGSNGYKSNVRSAIKRIRRKFLNCDPSFVEIGNFTAFGYMWGQKSASTTLDQGSPSDPSRSAGVQK